MNWKRIIGVLLVGAGLLVLALNLNWLHLVAQQKWAADLLAKPAVAKAMRYLQTDLLAKPVVAKAMRYAQTGKAYNPVAVAPLALGMILLLWSFQRKRKDTALLPGPAGEATPLTPAATRIAARAPRHWHSCNVLQVGLENRQLWQFDSRGNRFTLNREQTTPAGETLPAYLVRKTWRSLWQNKLNVAWLPAEHVFLRVAKFPQSSFDETAAMVELQLEKFSPLPVAQIVWSIHVMPGAADQLQTVVIIIAARSLVEEFLGQLEGQGYLADRLELPLLDQLQGSAITEDGASIYPDRTAANARALIAWWYGGSLQQLDLVNLAGSTDRTASLKEQIAHAAWSGELDGWLTGPPRWHLVADAAVAGEWLPLLNEGLGEPVEVIAPLPPSALAAATARRAAQATPKASLLPAEFSLRYQQQFVDRLWMRGLGAVLSLYVIGVLIYFVALEVLIFRVSGVESKVADLSQSYTNVMQLKARHQVLQDRQELKYAALDCWNVAAELMPPGLTLDSYSFTDGKKATFGGTAPADQVNLLIDFTEAFRKAKVQDKPMFKKSGDLNYSKGAAGNAVSWNFSCELNRTEAR
jgi:hypothetical protein